MRVVWYQKGFPTLHDTAVVPVEPSTYLASPRPASASLAQHIVAVLQELLVQLLHLSAARNVPFKKYLETGMAVEDLRNASFAASLVPGETSEEFRRNLLSIAKKANLHDRYRTDAGLDATEVEHS